MKAQLRHPVLMVVIGLPNSGKTALATHLSKQLQVATVKVAQLQKAVFGKQPLESNDAEVLETAAYCLADELLNLKLSVLADVDAQSDRRRARFNQLAQKHKCQFIIIYQQVDRQTAWLRWQSRHAQNDLQNQQALAFETACQRLEAPQQSKVIVVSGLHSLQAQAQTVIRRLVEWQLVDADHALAKSVPMPGLVNLIAEQSQKPTDKVSISLKQ